MMDEEEVRPKPKWVQRPELDSWSVEELVSYIGELRDEIARAEAAILKKQQHKSAADGFFKKPA